MHAMADLFGGFVARLFDSKSAQRKPTRRQPSRRLAFESFEERRMLSGTAGTIDAIQVNQGSQTDIFAIGNDHQVYLETSNGAGGWNPWNLTQAGTVKEIAVAHDGSGDLHVFAIRDDNQVWQEQQVNGVWTAWTLTHAGYAQDISAQANVAPGGALTVFSIGSDNQVYSESLNGGNWSDWALTRAGTAKQISVMMDSTGETHVFAIGMDNQVWTEHAIQGGSWSVWTLTQPGVVQQISAPTATTSGTAVKVFAVGADGQIYVETAANNWKGWTLTQPGTTKGMSALNNSTGTTIVFSVAADSQVYKEVSANPWSAWTLTAPGNLLGGGIVDTPAPAMTNGGTQPIYTPGGPPILLTPFARLAKGMGDFANSSLKVTDTSAYINDRLGIASGGSLVVAGSSLIVNGTAVGTFTAGKTMNVTFNASATQGAVLAVLQNITFSSIVPTPMIADRPVTISLKSGALGYQSSMSQTVELMGPPPLAVGSPAMNYHLGSAPINVAPATTLGQGAFANSRLTVADTSPYINDRLGIQSAGALVVSGSTLVYNGVVIGSFTAGRTVTVSFNANATQASIRAVVQNITFTSIVPKPMTGDRGISFHLRVGADGYVVTSNTTVKVTA
jgi:hypothetical protein